MPPPLCHLLEAFAHVEDNIPVRLTGACPATRGEQPPAPGW